MNIRIRLSAIVLYFVSVYAWPLAPTSLAAEPAANPDAAAEFVITTQILRPRDKVPPLGANDWGRCGAVEWAANNFVHNAGNEPIYWRNLHRVKNCGANWLEIDGPGTSWYDLWASGFLSGANLRVYRLVDKANQPLPAKGDYLDIEKADHAQLAGKTTIIPEGSPNFPDGGWIANVYCTPFPNSSIRHGNLKVTDASGLQNGRTYWYAVVAVGADNQESDISNEVSATPHAGADAPPHILIGTDGDKVPDLKSGAKFEFNPKLVGGTAPYRWEVLDNKGNVTEFPASLNLRIDAATGRIFGTPAADVADLHVELRVTDAKGRSDRRWYVLNAKASQGTAAAKGKPQPPLELTAVAADGCVTLAWKANPTPGAVAYRLKRSTAPAAQQMQRVYVSDGAPKLEKWDYIVLEKRFSSFDMKYVNPRVRGIGNPMDRPSWYWNGDPKGVSFSCVPHPQPVPAGMIDPGETCMKVQAAAGEQRISQTVFIGTQHGGESVWYGQLEPGKQYRLEVWLRQEGLGGNGAVTFSYANGYPGIKNTFGVIGDWRKYAFDFAGPERPAQPMHFGHTFAFTGPGTLWMDNCRIFRVDRAEDADKLYVPNQTVLDDLLASQPAAGPKGAHRIWFLNRDATMSSILSWHANSAVNLDWSTSVRGTMEMTLPMGLSFDLRTGDSPQTRMRPWLVLQHILHTEQDWLNFIEYLAAPYDPQRDTPQAKPWAFRRYQQRGVGTPWTDEFAEIILEFGNETWHNGHFADWLGFGRYNAIWQGGPEYGLFCRYLIETMKTSPYWKSQELDRKLRFNLGAGYNGSVDKDGKVRGYGEEAMQTCPNVTALGHANYVGPKWETGDKAGAVFDDHGVQATLLAFLAGPEPSQIKMGAARNALEKTHHAYDIVAYEGGPSGYALPGRDSPEQKLANEKYGKSLAMGVASLDAWMRSYAYGWTYQNFLGYGQGMYWNSHTPLWDGFRPSPGWQALVLRNRFAGGDLMSVEEKSSPTIQWDKKNHPLVGAYAMRDGERWSVFVVSRKLDGKHDGHDFGDGSTPVTLRLPFQSAGKIALHKLAGDPRQSNREKLAIQPETWEIPSAAIKDGVLIVNEASGGVKGGMPAGSILLYVFEGTGTR
ncbi:MAG: hypothetical protein ACHRHE_15685 [Tepidisphaerales bacterium]